MPLLGDPNALPCPFMKFRDIYYVEADGSPSAVYAMDRGQVTRSYYVDWADRDAAALAFAGSATVVTAPDGRRYISRTLPHALPYKDYMRVQTIIAVKPIGMRANTAGTPSAAGGMPHDGSGVANYAMAELVCQYVFPTFRFLEDAAVEAEDGPLENLPDEGWALANLGIAGSRYVTRTLKFTTKEMVVNRALLRDENRQLILEGFPLRETTAEVTYTHHQVPESALPTSAWVAGGSAVNEFEFDGWPPETLLASSMPEARPSPNVVDGQMYYDLTYRFSLLLLGDHTTDPVTIRGHNHIRRLVTLTPLLPVFKPLRVTSDGGDGVAPGTSIFPGFDFQSFFRPNQG